MLLHIIDVKVCGPHSLEVQFNNGVHKRFDLTAYFARVVVDAQAGTVVWPNGADLAPEALYDLPDNGSAGSSVR